MVMLTKFELCEHANTEMRARARTESLLTLSVWEWQPKYYPLERGVLS